MRHSHVFNFCLIFFKLGKFVLQLIPLYGIATQHFRIIYSVISYALFFSAWFFGSKLVLIEKMTKFEEN